MRTLTFGVGVGATVMVVKLVLQFTVWLVPLLLEVLNAGALLGALIVLALLARRRKRWVAAGGVALALAVAMLDLPVSLALGHAFVASAKSYCVALGDCAANRCPALAGRADGNAIPELPGRSVPMLLRAGYSVRYAPRFSANRGGLSCTFPDPFPGRVFWEGESRPDGRHWTWENLMD